MKALSLADAFKRGGAIIALLLFFVLSIAGCSSLGTQGDGPDTGSSGGDSSGETASQNLQKLSEMEDSMSSSGSDEKANPNAVKSITPEDILSEDELASGAPETRDWNAPTDADVISLPGSEGSSAGAIPAVKPFNFGRDPGGPEDKTLYLTIPKLGLTDVPVYNELTEEALTASTVHHPATGFPWQTGANTFIAGHRIGYEGTGSLRIFYDVPSLVPGDEITVTDADGNQYVYSVTGQETVGTDNVASMNPVEGESMISLQTCTLPDYSERVIVHGELVQGDTV